jgi:spore maturation protein CgeB
MLSNEKILNLTFISTSSHGYLKIDKQTFKQFNLNGSEFSQCSYYQPNNNCFYLEEDCDAPKFIKIVKDKGYKVNFNEINIDELSLGREMAA